MLYHSSKSVRLPLIISVVCIDGASQAAVMHTQITALLSSYRPLQNATIALHRRMKLIYPGNADPNVTWLDT